MAEVKRGQDCKQGIKLFGATITLHEEEVKEGKKEEEKVEKKVDKIIPCPRCKSMETKFCYFNNYNVNQPRHFCKGCQRYWTAGGALRNVPVGAGRRKAKPPCRVAGEIFSPEDGCLYDFETNSDDVNNKFGVEHGLVLDNWHVAMAPDQSNCRQIFPAKRRRTTSAGNLNHGQ